MNYQSGLIVCTILETIASNNNNHLGDINNMKFPSIRPFSYAFGKIIRALNGYHAILLISLLASTYLTHVPFCFIVQRI